MGSDLGNAVDGTGQIKDDEATDAKSSKALGMKLGRGWTLKANPGKHLRVRQLISMGSGQHQCCKLILQLIEWRRN